jgi:transcriptional regulator with XRE-family HTH domain
MGEMIAYRNAIVNGGIANRQFRVDWASYTLPGMDQWGKRLKAWTRTAQITQDYLAGKMDVTQGTVANWLSGRREINLSDFFKLCEFAGVDAQYILFGTVPVETPATAALNRVLEQFPELQSKIVKPAAKNDAVAAALGPLPPRRVKRAARKKRVKT